MKRNKMKKVISFLLLLCFLVLELSGVAEVFAAERKGNEYSGQEMAGNHYDWNDDFSNEVSKDYENVWEHKNNRDEKADMPQEDSPIFHHIDKDVFEKKNHTSRYKDEEDLNTYVFGNEDGTKTIYYMYENVKFIDENGEIKDKDISLVKKDKGYGIVENELDLYLPENPSDGIDVEYSGYTVKLIPQGGDSAVTATQDADFVVYEQYFDENSSLKYTPLLSGIKEDIILAAYAENVSYDFIVETDGLYIYNDEKGYYLADESNTKIVFYLGDVEVYDAVGKPCMGEMEVSTLEEGQRYLLTLSVDDEFLADPTTVYPVTIDPTLTISDTATGADSIMDAPIFAGYPSKNYAKYKYNTVGTTTASYGIGRTVVKLPGLTSSTEYASITASQISSVKFYVRDSSGTGKQTINLYPLKTAWTETSVTWNNVGAYVSSVNYANTLSSGKVTGFDITGLVKGWKNETYSADAGFILINSTETNNKSFCSSEYSTTSYRPYVEMTYSATISLSRTTYSMDEGGSFTLTATTKPSGLSVTWSSSNTTVATVSSAGVVTGKKAGTAVITAKCVDADGVTHTATCTVYVCVADGVYYIQNMNSGYYLNVNGGYIESKTDVIQYSKYSSYTTVSYRLRQMWKVKYLGNGYYSIRPMHKLNMGLDVTSGNVDIWNIGTTDTLSGVPSYGEWTIEWNSSGYIFKNAGDASKTMQVNSASTSSGATVIASTYSSVANCRWTLSKISSPPSGVMWYDTYKKATVTTPTVQVGIDETKTLATAKLYAIAYSGTSISQTFSWTSADTSIATVDSSTGAITGKAVGETTITGTIICGGVQRTLTFNVCVGYPAVFDTLIDYRILSSAHVDYTDDGFFVSTKPLSLILISKGILELPKDEEGSGFRNVANYYDDWYLFAVENNGEAKYGLYKMREIETDEYDGNTPGVTVSFIALDENVFLECLDSYTTVSGYALLQRLDWVTGPELHNSVDSHDEIIVNYFADTASEGAYLIAENYISFIAKNSVNGEVVLSSEYSEVLEWFRYYDTQLSNCIVGSEQYDAICEQRAYFARIPEALCQINANAGYTIYDEDNMCINITDKNNLTKYEKYAILAAFTADITFNSFAAEVEFHADAVCGVLGDIEAWYSHAVRADMHVESERDIIEFGDYYDLEGNSVIAQAKAHGEY